jgi:hypothetical protein
MSARSAVNTISAMLRCSLCARRYPRKRLMQARSQTDAWKTLLTVCGCCMTEKAGVLRQHGIAAPGAKRRRIMAASARTYNRRMLR